MSETELRDLLSNYSAARDEYEIAKKVMEDCEAELLSYLKGRQQKSAQLNRGNGTTMRVTVVSGSIFKLDELKLKKRLGARVWNRYTNRVIDKKKLEAGMEAGDVDPVLVGQCSTEVPKATYLKVSEGREDA